VDNHSYIIIIINSFLSSRLVTHFKSKDFFLTPLSSALKKKKKKKKTKKKMGGKIMLDVHART
jgi:hypothetical protein